MRDKQIEEMAKIICLPTANKGNCEKCGFKKHCSKFDDATALYNAGYRKASDVALEVISEVEKRVNDAYNKHIFKSDLEDTEKEAIMDFCVDITLYDLKKKYESENN
jgi:hypothetical protein